MQPVAPEIQATAGDVPSPRGDVGSPGCNFGHEVLELAALHSMLVLGRSAEAELACPPPSTVAAYLSRSSTSLAAAALRTGRVSFSVSSATALFFSASAGVGSAYQGSPRRSKIW